MNKKNSPLDGLGMVLIVLVGAFLLIIISRVYPVFNLHQKTAMAIADVILTADNTPEPELTERLKAFCAKGEREYKVVWTNYHAPVYASCEVIDWTSETGVYINLRFADQQEETFSAIVRFKKNGEVIGFINQWDVANQTDPPRYLTLGPVVISPLVLVSLLMFPTLLMYYYVKNVLQPAMLRGRWGRRRNKLARVVICSALIYVESAFLTLLVTMAIEGQNWRALFHLF